MRRHIARSQTIGMAVLAVLFLLQVSRVAAYGQGGVTTSLSGTVVDSSGAFMPGVSVTVKNNATSAESSTVTGGNGTFAIPALNPGTYTVTVALMGFKTAVLNDVVLSAATPASVRVPLAVGGVEETVVVQAAGEIVQTQSPSVAVTVDINRISNLPLASRGAMDIVAFLPGVQSPGSTRESQINGLPQSAISLTWDGVNIQDNHLKTTDGFFATLNPRLDAVEEVTLTTAAQGAEATGQGSVRVNFVTRSGSDKYVGSAYHYYRNDALNANTWSRNRDGLEKANLLQNQPGMRLGGPIRRGQAFFFFNYEESRQPGEFTVSRTVLHPTAQQGVFRYNSGGTVQEVNVLDVAGRNGHLASVDPVVAKLLADIRASTNGTGTITSTTNPLTQSFAFAGVASTKNRYPTGRVDYNVTPHHRLTATTSYQTFANYPDQTNNREVRFPGFPSTAGQTSWRTTSSFSVRLTLGSNLVNEAQVGISNYEFDFSAGVSMDQFTGATIGNQAGYNLTLGLGLTGATSQAAISARHAPLREFRDTVSWIKGSHSLSMGGTFSQANLYAWSQTLLPGVTFGVDTAEAVNGIFNTTNFPNASGTNLTDARNFYALLTGRVATITGNAVLNEAGTYEYNGNRIQKGYVNELGFFVQDGWRVRPNLTLSGGLRWELQMPFVPGADNYTTAEYADVFGISGLDSAGNPNIFKPGTIQGRETQFLKYAKGTRAYAIDYGNFAPTGGFAWTVNSDKGFLRRLLGEEGSVIRAGYSMAYLRNGMSDYSGIFGSNPGSQITATRSNALGNLNMDGAGLPVLFRDSNRLGAPAFATTPVYPLTLATGAVQVTNSVNVFDPEMQTPRSQSWNVAFARPLTRNMSIELRYVGTRGQNLWQTIDYNEFNIVENGFLDEFRRAQANLQANIAGGRGNTFAYTGAPGTSPLPTFLGFFNGLSAAQAGDTARYAGTNWTNSTFLGYLARNNPNPFGFASAGTNGLMGSAALRANAQAAGLAPNFFVVNPGLLGGANVRTNAASSHYDSFQVELRRRLSNGLQAQASYAYGNTYVSNFYSLRREILDSIDTGTPGSVPHAFKGDWLYQLPFGRGRHFASNAGAVMDRVIGGWSLSGTVRLQSGQVVEFGNVRLVGMSAEEFKGLYGFYEYPQVFTANGPTRVYRLPQDIVENTLRANDVSATSATGYGAQGSPVGRYLAPANGPDCIESTDSSFGECGTRVLQVAGPLVKFFDLSVLKQVPVAGRLNLEFRVDFLNALNTPNFLAGTTGEISSTSSRVIQLVSRVSW